MKNTKHTAEPWFVGDGGHLLLADSSNAIAIACDNEGDQFASANVHTCEKITPDERRANLARIVACVNACRGLATEDLLNEGAAVEAELNRLKAVQAELMLLVQSLADSRIIGGKGSAKYRRLANEVARAAIRKAKGEQ